MIIQHNIPSLNINNRLTQNKKKADNVLEKLSSGYKINRAGDDAAGLAISEKMRGQIRGLNMAGKNIQDGISLIQTAEGALNEVHSLLQRGRELSVQSANDTNTRTDRVAIQMEIEEIKKEITSIGNNTEFNTKKLLNGSLNISSPSPSSTLSVGGKTYTAKDGWISFQGYTVDDDQTNKIKLNEGEKVIDDPANGFYTGFFVIGEYDVNGVAKSISLYNLDHGVITVRNPSLLFSYNGTTIDLRHRKSTEGDHWEGVINLTPGENQPTDPTDNGLKLQIGANSGQTTELTIPDIRSQAIGINNVSVLDSSLAQSSISSFDRAINLVSSVRSSLGAHQNRLEYAFNSVTNTSENLQSAESRIRDTDMAKEMMTFTKNNILLQATQSMLAQSNKQPEGILQLLQ
ncbi:flagellin [Lysinibacillus sp. HST-98]|uniref:flagellin N-terminal helical domain-containing protein n=1 Tax=Lysinibacillus sp. HST-98 TaxID=2800419 RepID=UPI001925586B|nr:flagellin [Lysinibacillus sp. HST-98]